MALDKYVQRIPALLTGTRVGLLVFTMAAAGRLVKVEVKTENTNSNGPLTLDVNTHNTTTEVGTSIYAADPAQRPSVAAGQKRATWQASDDGVTVAVGQTVTVDADVVPSGGIGPFTVALYVEDDAGIGSRSNVAVTTPSIAYGATREEDVTLGRTSLAFKVTTSVAARVRAYNTAARRTADASRPVGQLPTGTEHGVLMDVVTETANLIVDLAPVPVLANADSPTVAQIYFAITNLSGSSGPVTVTISRIPLEQ